MRILITRPREDAEGLAAALTALGHEVFIEPLLTIALLPAADAPLVLAGVQALLFTSANGVRAYAARSDQRYLPVFAVGDATAQTAKSLGFARIASAGGDVSDLAALVAAELDPRRGSLLHPAASAVAGDLQGRLAAKEFAVKRAVIYRAETASEFTAACREQLSEGRFDLATFYSPRTAACFARLAAAAGLAPCLVSCRAACLSAAVAEKISSLPWAKVAIAERPEQDSFLALIGQMEKTGANKQ